MDNMINPHDTNTNGINVSQGSEVKRKNPFKIFLPIVLVLVLVGVIGLGVYEYLRIKPNDVKFTNITSSSVTVSWNTKSPISASVLVFEGDTWFPVTLHSLGGERFYDTRDVKEAEKEQRYSVGIGSEEVSFGDIHAEVLVDDRGEYYTHHVTVTGLNSETEYSFMIGDRYIFRKVEEVGGESPVKTVVIPENISPPFPAYGSIRDAQGREGVPVEELVSVTDGVVYFNYLDEFAGERSAVHSGSLNEEGNWYIDVAALGDFASERSDKETLLVELMIDSGPLGLWKKEIDIDYISPADIIIINDPLAHNDPKFGIERLEVSLLGNIVQPVEASACMFSAYCGPCCEFKVSGGSCEPCSCDQAMLKSRKCPGESTRDLQTVLQENKTSAEAAAAATARAEAAANLAKSMELFRQGELESIATLRKAEAEAAAAEARAALLANHALGPNLDDQFEKREETPAPRVTVSNISNAVGTTVGFAVGAGVGVVAGPIVGTAAGYTAGHAASTVVEAYLESGKKLVGYVSAIATDAVQAILDEVCEACESDTENYRYFDPENISLKAQLEAIAGVKVFADNTETYLLDSNTGIFIATEPGVYSFEYEGEEYLFYIDEDVLNVTEGSIILFIDVNENGEYDEGVDVRISDYVEQIELKKIINTYSYDLWAGFNLVTFPFVFTQADDLTASGLLALINERAEENIVYSISKFDGRWKVVGQNGTLYDNNDFRIIPGQGYLIKTSKPISLSFLGKPVKFDDPGDNAPLTFFEGWNLVGLYGTGVKTYTAQSLLTDINASNFTADNISRWEKEKQMYDGLQMSEGQEYGFDFPINPLEGVFVRILEGRGNWQPKLRTQ